MVKVTNRHPMGKCDLNTRHQEFKRNLRAYHDSINRKNRYNLAKIAGKLDVFESEDGELKTENGVTYEIDRKIPNTALTVLEKNGVYAIGDIDGNPLTEFKYSFIEGCLGNHDKIVQCVTDDGEMENFSVESETIVEDASGGATGGMQTADIGGFGVTDNGCNGGDKDYTEIDYSNIEKQMMIPYLCGARVIDIGKRRKKKRRATR